MKIVDLVKRLDRMVEKGKIIEAFEKFFSDDVITHSTAGDKSEGKAEKREFLKGFFENMEGTDDIKLHDSLIDDDKTYSAYTFKFRNKQNEMLVWNEIIQRTWKNGQVVDEYYFAGDMDNLKKEIASKQKALKNTKAETPASPDVKSPAKVASPIKKAESSKKKSEGKKGKSNAKQNLKLVEGIGPKIEQLLNADGIKTFADLASAKQAKLETILSDAGPRFSMHSPATWPKQAKLLAAGKQEELKKLQDKLKGGRKV